MKFFVAGIPVPKGSMRAFRHRTTGRVVTIADNREKLRGWSSAVAVEAVRATRMIGWRMICGGPIALEVRFVFERPKSSRRVLPTVPPDIDKALRAIMDALTGVIYLDDAQVVDVHATKKYGDKAGVHLKVSSPSLESPRECV